MIFPFTFNINVAGLTNPFSQVMHIPEKNSPSVIHGVTPRALRPPSFTGLTDQPTLYSLSRPSRKRARGWEVPIPEPSLSTSSLESTGYLDKPSKYRKMADGNSVHCDENEALDIASDLPPAKRRRTIAGSIISTAINAALYGGAVGLTVFRLWRGRGEDRVEEIEQPPPPYQQGFWVEPEPEPQPIQVAPTTPTPRSSRTRHPITPKSASRRRRQPKPQLHRHTTSPSSAPAPRPEFDFSAPQEDADPDDQMDWLGGKLAAMIEEGKKALSREVVVQSESQEDEFDDGSDAWVDDHEQSPSATRHRRRSSRSGSLRRSAKRPRSIAVPSPGHTDTSFSCTSASPRASEFSMDHPATPHHPGFAIDESSSGFESPELREQMEMARARVLARIRR